MLLAVQQTGHICFCWWNIISTWGYFATRKVRQHLACPVCLCQLPQDNQNQINPHSVDYVFQFPHYVYMEPVTAVVESDKQGAIDKFANGHSAAICCIYSSPSVIAGKRSTKVAKQLDVGSCSSNKVDCKKIHQPHCLLSLSFFAPPFCLTSLSFLSPPSLFHITINYQPTLVIFPAT